MERQRLSRVDVGDPGCAARLETPHALKAPRESVEKKLEKLNSDGCMRKEPDGYV